MINIKPVVAAALKNDSILQSITTDKIPIHDYSLPKNPVFPAITYTEQDNSPGYYADNTEISSKIAIGIDIFDENNGFLLVNNIALRVNDIMKSLGFERNFCYEFKNKEFTQSNVFQKTMRFVAAKEL